LNAPCFTLSSHNRSADTDGVSRPVRSNTMFLGARRDRKSPLSGHPRP
jgi:hypothetical protein